MKAIRLSVLMLGFILSSQGIKAQAIGNEWIDYSLDYYRIPVAQSGVHYITQSQLISAGIPVAGINPSWFRLYGQGVEVPLHIVGGADGTFDPTDRILFYGRANDGWLDDQLYANPANHLNKNYSLFNDTATYFLTWEPIPGALRYSVDADFNFAAYTAAPFFTRKIRSEYPTAYYGGKPEPSGVTLVDYVAGEGFFENAITIGGTITRNIPTPVAYAAAGNATVRICVVGASDFAGSTLDPQNRDHHLRIEFAGQVIDTLYDGYVVTQFTRSIPHTALGSSQTAFVFKTIDDLATPTDRNALAFIELDYNRSFSFSGENHYLAQIPSNSTKTRADITGFAVPAADSLLVVDFLNNKLIRTEKSGSIIRALLPASSSMREVAFVSSSAYIPVAGIEPVSPTGKFTYYLGSPGINYLIVSHPSLINGPGGANDYSTYRNQSGFQSIVLNVEELYDQYSYGIRKHPLAIRNMVRDFVANYGSVPEYLFLIGKSYKAPEYRKNSFRYENTLVPTIAYPPSDVLYTSGLGGGGFAPLIATGRLSATTLDDVDLYLDKVMAHENAMLNPQPWMKKVLHFGGGTSLTEQNTLASFLNGFKKIIEDTLFGGHVQTFLKSSTDPIQINQSTYLKQEIDGGVSLMTFYGHASGVGFDISTDQPSEYNNEGKYPFIIANSCFAGDIFAQVGPGNIWSSSEEFVLIREKGAIGYLAAVSAAGTGGLQVYSSEIYKQIAYKNYGQPIGKVIQSGLQTLQSTNPFLRELCLDMTLHGDPGVRLPNHSQPDYAIGQGSIYFDPPLITSELPSFDVKVVSQNLGRAVSDSMIVELSIRRPDNSIATFQQLIPSTRFRDTLTFTIPVDPNKDIGMNYVRATLDAFNTIAESIETNNQNAVEVPLNIRSADILPVLPIDDAIEPAAPKLIASTLDPFAPSRTYLWDLDTTDLFNSPLKVSHQITSVGGILTWTPGLPLKGDSLVYYWRVSPDTSGGSPASWRMRSFQVISGNKGWGQSHIFQFGKDSYRYVNYNRSLRGFEFVNDVRSLHIQTGYYPYIPFTEEWYRLDGAVMGAWNCAYLGHAVKVAVFDPTSGNPWASYDVGGGIGPWGEMHCQPYTVYGFDYYTDSVAWRQKIVNLIQNVPDSFPVMVMSHRNTFVEDWEEPLYQAFESIGSVYIRTLQNNLPYIIFGKKGAAIGTAREVIAQNQTSIIQLKDSLITKWNQGWVASPVIGPASSWESAHWQVSSNDNIAGDEIRLSIVGITANGIIDTLISQLPPDSADIFNLSSRVPAAVYPFLKLVMTMRDDSLHTPAHIDRWQVLYTPVPETAIDPQTSFLFEGPTLRDGENLKLQISTRNISQVDFPDSLVVRYWIYDQNRNLIPVTQRRLQMHPAGSVITDTLIFPVHGLQGSNSLWVEFNPIDSATGTYFQQELTHLNNTAELAFTVEKDNVPPLLDVTFDGVHILDGEIVSAKPLIRIALKDENPFIPITDTAAFKVMLQYPNENFSRRIYFREGGQEQMNFIPGSLPENEAVVEYMPELLTDGIYLLTVQARDMADNQSGANDYKISFEVVNKMTVTEVLNWPNPFSTSTRFVFTLTGSEVPDVFKIQIMTITGIIVREIDASELGNIHIGRNISDFAWDGTDQYGDPLANGVYLYRVITSYKGDAVEKKENQASKYFKHGIGKMYLMR